MKIAVLITCHNRCKKTESCLISLKKSLCIYNKEAVEHLHVEIFLTNDGCTDETAHLARQVFPSENVLHILQGNGNLFWAGGMRFCWREAMKRHSEWDYYLLLNDDTDLMDNLFNELFDTEEYVVSNYGKQGIVSGITCSRDHKMTYGGAVWKNKFLATRKQLGCCNHPQLCDVTNANILLVPKVLVDDIGIFYEKYQHGLADFDYSYMARKAGYPVVITTKYCGYCEMDHEVNDVLANKLIAMSLEDRKAYFNNPVHSIKDYLRFIKRISPIRVPMVAIGRMLNLYFPKLYYQLHSMR